MKKLMNISIVIEFYGIISISKKNIKSIMIDKHSILNIGYIFPALLLF